MIGTNLQSFSNGSIFSFHAAIVAEGVGHPLSYPRLVNKFFGREFRGSFNREPHRIRENGVMTVYCFATAIRKANAKRLECVRFTAALLRVINAVDFRTRWDVVIGGKVSCFGCRPRKAVENHRTPKRWRVGLVYGSRGAFWSAPVLWRFVACHTIPCQYRPETYGGQQAIDMEPSSFSGMAGTTAPATVVRPNPDHL